MSYPRTLDRLPYLVCTLGWLFVVRFLALHIAALLKADTPAWLLIAALILSILVKFIFLDLPRLRSIGWSQWYILLRLVPIANIAFEFCLFFKGPAEDNSYDYDSTDGRFVPGPVITVVIVILIVAFALGVGYATDRYLPKHQTTSVKSNATAAPPKTPAPASSASESFFSFTRSHDTKTPPFRIQSIFYPDSEHASAVIDGNSVAVGEQVGQWLVTAIHSNSVTLQYEHMATNIPWAK